MKNVEIRQIVRADESYTVREFRRLTGLGEYAFRQARKNGLPVREVGKFLFVRGVDWHEFLARQASESQAENSIDRQ